MRHAKMSTGIRRIRYPLKIYCFTGQLERERPSELRQLVERPFERRIVVVGPLSVLVVHLPKLSSAPPFQLLSS